MLFELYDRQFRTRNSEWHREQAQLYQEAEVSGKFPDLFFLPPQLCLPPRTCRGALAASCASVCLLGTHAHWSGCTASLTAAAHTSAEWEGCHSSCQSCCHRLDKSLFSAVRAREKGAARGAFIDAPPSLSLSLSADPRQRQTSYWRKWASLCTVRMMSSHCWSSTASGTTSAP